MYYVDEKQINQRLDFFPVLLEGLEKAAKQREQITSGDQVAGGGQVTRGDHITSRDYITSGHDDQLLLISLAEERLLHLAIEAVTDIGSFIIDGLMLREASSYEDILVVLQGEDVFSAETAEILISLVKERRSLVQEYFLLDRTAKSPLLAGLSEALVAFSKGVETFLDKERF